MFRSRDLFFRTGVGLVACALVFLGCGSQSGSTSKGARKRRAAVSEKVKAPDFELRDLSGNTVSLRSFKGKVVFLDFWATWCPPCVMSSPEVQKLEKDYGGKGVEVLSISLDQSEDTVRRFMEDRDLSVHTAVDGVAGVAEKYRVNGIPAFFLIDKNGYLVGSWEGYHPSFVQNWRKGLDQLLKA